MSYHSPPHQYTFYISRPTDMIFFIIFLSFSDLSFLVQYSLSKGPLFLTHSLPLPITDDDVYTSPPSDTITSLARASASASASASALAHRCAIAGSMGLALPRSLFLASSIRPLLLAEARPARPRSEPSGTGPAHDSSILSTSFKQTFFLVITNSTPCLPALPFRDMWRT